MSKQVLSISVLACFATAALAQAPVNDGCAGAPALALGANVGTTLGATAEGPACGAGFLATTNDVFYVYTPAVDEACTLALTSGNVDRGAVFVGACGSLAPVSCTVAAAVSTTTPLTWFGQAGVTYTIRLGRVSATLGVYTATFSTTAPPSNDDCSAPIVLADGINPNAPAGMTGMFFSSLGATTSLNPGIVCAAGGTYGQGAFDVWFEYAAAVNGPTLIQTCTPSGFVAGSFTDTNLQVFTGTCGALTEVVCDTDSCTAPNFNSLLSLTASAGTTYAIRVSGFSAGATSASGRGTFYITVSPPVPAPSNDECVGADNLAVGPNAGNTAGATVSADPVGGCVGFTGATIDTWHSFTVLSACTAVVTRTGAGANQLGLYAGVCGALVDLACGTTSVAAVVAPGTYYVRVGQTSAVAAAAYSLDFQCVAAPANDDCSAADPAALGANAGGTGGATPSLEPAGACTGFTATTLDVWHSFTPAANGTFRAATSGSGADQIGVYDATGGCGGPALACGTTVAAPFAAAAGAPLLIRVGQTAFASQGAYTLTLTLVENDDCAGALPVVVGVNGPYSSVGAFTANDTGFTTPNLGTGSGCPFTSTNGSDLFYTYTSDCDATVTVSTCDGDGTTSTGELADTQITVHDAWTCGVGSSSLLACNDDNGSTSTCGPSGFQSTATFPMTAGQTVLIRVASFTATTQGSYSLTLSRTTAQLATIGTGCGPGPVPTLTGSGLPQFGTSFTLTVQAQPSANGALLGAPENAGMVYAPFGPCTIYLLQPGLVFLLPVQTDLMGQWTLNATLPAYDPVLDCAVVELQAFVIGAAGIEFTNALRLVFGT
jgi:hypothetical protein